MLPAAPPMRQQLGRRRIALSDFAPELCPARGEGVHGPAGDECRDDEPVHAGKREVRRTIGYRRSGPDSISPAC